MYVRILSLRFQVSLWFCKKVFTNPKNCSITCIPVAKYKLTVINYYESFLILKKSYSWKKKFVHDNLEMSSIEEAVPNPYNLSVHINFATTHIWSTGLCIFGVWQCLHTILSYISIENDAWFLRNMYTYIYTTTLQHMIFSPVCISKPLMICASLKNNRASVSILKFWFWYYLYLFHLIFHQNLPKEEY